jgi:hypothetical protein
MFWQLFEKSDISDVACFLWQTSKYIVGDISGVFLIYCCSYFFCTIFIVKAVCVTFTSCLRLLYQ